MRMLKNAKGLQLFMSLSLIVTFALLINLPARADATEPDQFGFGPVTFVPLLMEQSYTIDLTASGSVGFHTVLVVSYGNNTASTQIKGMKDGFGFWTETMVGTGGRNFFDIQTGFWPYDGGKAEIDISRHLSFAVGTVTYFITDAGAGYPIKYQVKVGQ